MQKTTEARRPHKLGKLFRIAVAALAASALSGRPADAIANMDTPPVPPTISDAVGAERLEYDHVGRLATGHVWYVVDHRGNEFQIMLTAEGDLERKLKPEDEPERGRWAVNEEGQFCYLMQDAIEREAPPKCSHIYRWGSNFLREEHDAIGQVSWLIFAVK